MLIRPVHNSLGLQQLAISFHQILASLSEDHSKQEKSKTIKLNIVSCKAHYQPNTEIRKQVNRLYT